MSAAMILARSGEGWKSGPIGLAVILLLCVAVYFLFKSMSKHLRKVRDEFPTDEPPPSAAPQEPASPLKQPLPGPENDRPGGEATNDHAR
jgi:hypothetical protein